MKSVDIKERSSVEILELKIRKLKKIWRLKP